MTTQTDGEDGQARGGLRGLWRRLRQRWWTRWLIDAGLALMIFAVVMAVQARGLLGDGRPAPDFSLKAADGSVHQLSDYRGEKVLLVFWAPWCGVCEASSHNVSALHEAYLNDDDVAVLSVALDWGDMKRVRAYMDEHEVEYPVLLGDRDIARRYHIDRFPTLYVISEDGSIEDATIGYTSELGMRWRLWF